MNWIKNNKTLFGWLVALSTFIVILITVISIKGWNETGAEFFFKGVLLDNLLGVNALLLGTLTFVGYLILGKGFAHSFTGMLKTIIGVLFLSIGAGTLVGLAKPIFNGLTTISSTKVNPLDPYLGWTSSNNFLIEGISIVNNYVSWVSFALLVGFIWNIILVALKKWTNVQSLMVTGHIMFQQTAIMTAIVYVFLFQDNVGAVTNGAVPGASQAGIVIFTGLMIGTYWGVASTMTIKGTQKVTNNAGFAIGHQQMFGAAIAYKIGKYFGNPNDSAETKKISKKLKIFEDNIFTQSLIIVVLFMILIIILKTSTDNGFDPTMKGSPYKSWKVAGNGYWMINMFLGSLKIVASILVLTAGVRMFVTELQQAFQGIALKVIPGAVVAVDVAATYGFSPNAVTYGFISGLLAQFTAVGIIIGISVATNGGIPIIVPLFITLFFNSGSIGVLANASGGWKATIIVPAIFGFCELFIAAGALKTIELSAESAVGLKAAIDGKSPVSQGYIGMFDWNAIWGSQFIIAGQSVVLGWITMVTSLIAMLGGIQFVDTGMKKDQTHFQKLIKRKFQNIQNIQNIKNQNNQSQ